MHNVLVLGSGRSGTSMLAGTIAGAGAFVGDDPYPGRESNEKGFFEARDVNGINERLLAAALPRHSGFRAWQRWLAIASPDAKFRLDDELRARVRRLVRRAPWCFKDPRFSFTLPAWREELGDARFLAVFREPAATAESLVRECREAPYLRSLEFDFERGVDLWTAAYRRILDEHARDGDWLFLHFEQLLAPAGLDRVEEFLGARVARDFPEARLRRARSAAPVSELAAATYRELCARAGHPAGELAASEQAASTAAGPASAPAPIRVRERAPELSVILCTYNRRAVLAESLAGFERQTAARGSFELVVVDDGSTDGTGAWLAARGLAVPGTIVSRANGGLAAARNSGIAAARGRILLLVNDDTLPFPDLVEQHLALHRELGAAPAAVLGTFEQPREALDNALMRYLERSTEVFCYAALQPGELHGWNRFWTCNVSVSADLVRRAGGFDESFRRYGCEDTDLALRLDELGLRVVFHPGARAHHRHLLDLAALKRRQLTLAQAYVALFAKHPRALLHPDWAWVRPLSLAGCERAVDAARPDLFALEAAASELARVDIGALEAGLPGAPGAQGIVNALAAHVRALNGLWWRAGFAAGLAEHGLQGFRELLGADFAWPLATGAPLRVLAWPDWSTAGLEALWRACGEALAGRGDTCLVLRHDPRADGPLAAARERLASTFAASAASGRELDVLVFDDPLVAGDHASVGRSLACALELDASRPEPAQGFLAALGAPLLRPAELRAFLDRASSPAGA